MTPDSPTSTPQRRARRIRLLVLDVDGVLTDGGLYYGAGGESLQRFHVHDGAGIKAVMAAGIAVAIISARRTPAVTARMRELGVDTVIQGEADKLRALTGIAERMGIGLEAVACVGDDTADAPMMRQAGLAIAVADAQAAAVEAAHYRTTAPGGHGAVREACDLLLAACGESSASFRERRSSNSSPTDAEDAVTP